MVHIIAFPGDEIFLKVYYGRDKKEQKCYSIYRYGVLNQENAQGNEDPECFMSESTREIAEKGKDVFIKVGNTPAEILVNFMLNCAYPYDGNDCELGGCWKECDSFKMAEKKIENLINERENEVRKEMIEEAKNHYWDTFQKDKDLIIKHFENFERRQK